MSELVPRQAECRCGRLTSSKYARTNRLMFIDRSPESGYNRDDCDNCGYYRQAHEADYMSRNVAGNRRTVVERGDCSGYKPSTKVYATDLYWCGCGNTD